MPFMDEDAPPVIAQHNSSPVRSKEAPSLNLQQSNLFNDSVFSPQVKTPGTISPGYSLQGNSPSAMSVEYASPRSKQEPLAFPNTPTPIASGTTVTLIGIPRHRQSAILDMITEFGPITNVTKSDKEDANWVVVTFLNVSSAQKALALDGRMFDQSWILVVRTGDCFGVLDEKFSPKKPNREPIPQTAAPEAPFLQKKTRLFLSEQALMTPIPSKVAHHSIRSVEETELSQANEGLNMEIETPEKLYPSLPEEDEPPRETTWNQAFIPPVQDTNIIAASAEPAARPSGIISKISDFLFGW
jgi:hypothetical protein